MSWFVWLGLAALFTAVAAITGVQPIIFAYLAYHARPGG